MPDGFVLESKKIPSPYALNRLLSKCNQVTHPPAKLALALQKSDCHLSILDTANGNLAGFVRVTSDKGLNANLWNIAALPGSYQSQLLAVLINRILGVLKIEMPGCSVSVAAPDIAIKALQNEGFLLDPGGIRAMGIRLR